MGKDQTIIRLQEDYEIGKHPAHDANKCMSPGNAMYTVADGHRLGLNGLPMEIKKSGPITLSTLDFNLPSGYEAFLIDKKAGKTVPVTCDFNYTFSTDAGNTGSRFTLVLQPIDSTAKASLIRFNSFMLNGQNQIKLQDLFSGPAFYQVTDLSGRILQKGRVTLENNNAQLPAIAMPAVMYTVTLQPHGKTATSEKLMVGW